ncbi:hypothetical protein DPMN_103663 [Dreissena polymorpha]|uniref:VWFC domain-containing protein n=1 Tax=Dreissena polymorpha TaxID=45954 RepID=A0A9D4K104_DREPO|nr:hypothetical protein DPMN_103663 [Dreissena polymorpha]
MLLKTLVAVCLVGLFSRVEALSVACAIDDGTHYIAVGEKWASPTDPCFKCVCEEGGLLACFSDSCARPQCPAGMEVERSKTECCDYTCLRK